MNDFDRQIQAALRDSASGAPTSDQPNLAEELISTFRGRNRWLHGLVFVWSVVLFGLAVWAGVRFHGAEPLREQLLWGALALLAILMVAFIKVYFWLELHTNRILREIKRVELLVLQREQNKARP